MGKIDLCRIKGKNQTPKTVPKSFVAKKTQIK
jgi:hypothetical protein